MLDFGKFFKRGPWGTSPGNCGPQKTSSRLAGRRKDFDFERSGAVFKTGDQENTCLHSNFNRKQLCITGSCLSFHSSRVDRTGPFSLNFLKEKWTWGESAPSTSFQVGHPPLKHDIRHVSEQGSLRLSIHSKKIPGGRKATGYFWTCPVFYPSLNGRQDWPI